MPDPKLQSAWLQLSYPVLDPNVNLDPVLENKTIRLEHVGTVAAQPGVQDRADVVFALRRGQGLAGNLPAFAFWRRVPDLGMSFDGGIGDPLDATVRLIFALRRGNQPRYCESLCYPVLLQDAQTFQVANQLPPILDIYVQRFASPQGDAYKLFEVMPPGGPAAPKCAGCFNNPSPAQEAKCTQRGCYGETPATPHHFPEGV